MGYVPTHSVATKLLKYVQDIHQSLTWKTVLIAPYMASRDFVIFSADGTHVVDDRLNQLHLY